uniref:ABC-type branched-chain amino acid transport systems, periplasmic component n=1 Tax=Magnetospirillum gryphiswaldense TaxID=55518 RepID=A4TUT3_9PROT|nr:ABC-type branched-chain amino acid transport systems, periplasmic component [Magnetospirillum gryphiswaldense MSR-1]
MRPLAILALMLCAAAPARAAGPAGASDPSIVIGFVATRSGGGAVAGLDGVDGFTLALRQLGGRFSNQEVRVVAVDDKGSPDIARKQAARLIQSERLDMIVTAVTMPSLAANANGAEAYKLNALNLKMPTPSMTESQSMPHYAPLQGIVERPDWCYFHPDCRPLRTARMLAPL